ncbi:MAG: hypothetical protein JWN86_4275 [Planctomycetota bacterium]|nr:hypothetical protein [Planctomycetota bacterium]
MHRQIPGQWATRLFFALTTAACAIGCDSDGRSSRPPRVAAPVETTTVVVILPEGGLAELDVWEREARRQEVRTKALAEIHRLAPGDPPSKQADAIKQAVASGASALIVMPEDPRAVSAAIDEARKGGIPVVLLDRAVPTTEAPPPPLVRYQDERETAKMLVAAAQEEAKKINFPPEGPAMIVVNGPSDEHSKARVKALRDELQAAGVRVLPDVVFSGDSIYTKPALEAGFRASPHVAMVFAEDDQGVKAVASFRHLLDRKKRRFVMAGYTTDHFTLDYVKYNTCAALIDRNITVPMSKAFDAVLALVRGETVAGEIVVTTPFLRAQGTEKEGYYPPDLQHAGMTAIPGPSSSTPQLPGPAAKGQPPDPAAKGQP